MISFDKDEIKNILTTEQIFDFLQEWGGDPEFTNFGIISTTICHNEPGIGSRKLYFYNNSQLFKCFTGCENDIFDIFELGIKVMKIQHKIDWDLNDSVRYVASRIGFIGSETLQHFDKLEDWEQIEKYNRIQEISYSDKELTLEEYDKSILERLNYSLKIKPWLDEGISQEVLDYAKIGFFPGGDQISIPHYDQNNRFIGLRGRTLCQEEAKKYGKYRPLRINQVQYSHPLGMNLYGLNWAKDNIKKIKKAIIFESEKSVLLYMSIFGIKNNIATACCGSNVSIFQINSLLKAGAEEIVIGFDRQFQEIGDKEFQHLVRNLKRIHQKYSKYAKIGFLFDKEKITNYKSSPIDEGKEKFLQLWKNRIFL